MEPKISVLMSVYNEPIEWIKRSVNSVLEQSYKNKEIIVIVDNPDNLAATEYLIEKKKVYSNLTVEINSKNIGLVKSLNKGLKLCSGSYIARMDADDYSYKDRLIKQIAYMSKHNLDIVGCNIILNNGENKVEKRSIVFPLFCKRMVKYCTCVAHPTWLAKREVYDELKGYRNIDACEDFDFLNRAVLRGYRIGNMPETLFEYRINESSISSIKKYKQYTLMRFISAHYCKSYEVSID